MFGDEDLVALGAAAIELAAQAGYDRPGFVELLRADFPELLRAGEPDHLQRRRLARLISQLTEETFEAEGRRDLYRRPPAWMWRRLYKRTG